MMGLKTRVLACLAGRTLRKGLLWLGVLAVAWVLLLWQAVPRLAQWYLPKLVQERSGHTLHIGRLQLQPFTWALTVDDVLLSTPSQAPLLVLPHAMVDVAAMPLFLGRVQLDTVAVDGLQAHLGLAANGRLNWMDLIAAFKTPEPDPPQPPPAVFLRQVEVRQAVLHWRDERTQPAFVSRLEPFDLSLANVSTRADGQGKLNLQARTSLDAKLSVQTQFALNPLNAQGQVQLDGLNLAKLEALLRPILPMPAPQGRFSARAEFAIAAPATGKQTPTVQINQLHVELKQAELAANANPDAPRLGLEDLTLRQGQWHWPSNTLAFERIHLQGIRATMLGGAPLLGVKDVQIGPVALQFLQAKAQLGQFAAQGVELALQRQNETWAFRATLDEWQQAFVRKAGTLSVAPAEQATNRSLSQAPAQAWQLHMDGMAIKDIAIAYQDDDLAPGFATGLENAELTVEGIEYQLGTPFTAKVAVALRGNISTGGNIDLQAQLQPEPLQVEALLDVQKLGLPVASVFMRPYVKLDLAQGELNTRGRFQHNATSTRYQGSLSVENLRLVEQHAALNAKQVAAKADTVKKAVAEKPTFLSFKRLRAPTLEASRSSLRIPRLELQGLDTALLIAADRSTNIGGILVPSSSKKSSTVASSAEKQTALPPFSWRIDRFVLQNSEMDFADRSLVLPFGTRIHDLNGMITGLSSQPGHRAELTLKGAVDDYGLAQASGRLDPFDPIAFTDVKVNFRNVEMTNLTPYSATFANRRINSGKLSLELAYQVQNKALNSTNRILIDRLVLGERVQSPNAIDLPLDLAVAILQDASGKIDLGIPISGTLDDPQFSYGAVVMKALVNVLTKVVTAPFRALAGLLGGEQAAPDAVAFLPGQSQLDPPQREQLNRLAQILESRPKMRLVVHGGWAKLDQQAIQSRQLQQAVARQNGEKLAPGEEPGPLALESPAVQTALEALYAKQFGVRALFEAKGKATPQELATRLEAAQVVTEAQLQALALARQQALLAALLGQPQGVNSSGLVSSAVVLPSLTADRVQAGTPREVEPDAQQQVPVVLEVQALP